MVYAQIKRFLMLITFATVDIVAKCSLSVANILCMLHHHLKTEMKLDCLLDAPCSSSYS